VPGALFFTDGEDPVDIAHMGASDDQVRLIARRKVGSDTCSIHGSDSGGQWTVGLE
jgi:hypothetical protein